MPSDVSYCTRRGLNSNGVGARTGPDAGTRPGTWWWVGRGASATARSRATRAEGAPGVRSESPDPEGGTRGGVRSGTVSAHERDPVGPRRDRSRSPLVGRSDSWSSAVTSLTACVPVSPRAAPSRCDRRADRLGRNNGWFKRDRACVSFDGRGLDHTPAPTVVEPGPAGRHCPPTGAVARPDGGPMDSPGTRSTGHGNLSMN